MMNSAHVSFCGAGLTVLKLRRDIDVRCDHRSHSERWRDVSAATEHLIATACFAYKALRLRQPKIEARFKTVQQNDDAIVLILLDLTTIRRQTITTTSLTLFLRETFIYVHSSKPKVKDGMTSSEVTTVKFDILAIFKDAPACVNKRLNT
jgi:hypothetical protein